MDTNQIGTTVFCLYPTPNCLNPPSGVYNKAGFDTWIIENSTKKMDIATVNL